MGVDQQTSTSQEMQTVQRSAAFILLGAVLYTTVQAQLDSYSASSGYSSGNGGFGGNGGGNGGGSGGIADLEVNIPGTPGQDYPIYNEVPLTGFSCDGRVEGGYYADPDTECQVFHICANNGEGGLKSYSVLCPNGTIFNQESFVCDWWFNFDCSQAEGLYGINDANAAEAAAASPAGGNGGGSGVHSQSQYGAPGRR